MNNRAKSSGLKYPTLTDARRWGADGSRTARLRAAREQVATQVAAKRAARTLHPDELRKPVNR